jgi:hypothetical protein
MPIITTERHKSNNFARFSSFLSIKALSKKDKWKIFSGSFFCQIKIQAQTIHAFTISGRYQHSSNVGTVLYGSHSMHLSNEYNISTNKCTTAFWCTFYRVSSNMFWSFMWSSSGRHKQKDSHNYQHVRTINGGIVLTHL